MGAKTPFLNIFPFRIERVTASHIITKQITLKQRLGFNSLFSDLLTLRGKKCYSGNKEFENSMIIFLKAILGPYWSIKIKYVSNMVDKRYFMCVLNNIF